MGRFKIRGTFFNKKMKPCCAVVTPEQMQSEMEPEDLQVSILEHPNTFILKFSFSPSKNVYKYLKRCFEEQSTINY